MARDSSKKKLRSNEKLKEKLDQFEKEISVKEFRESVSHMGTPLRRKRKERKTGYKEEGSDANVYG